MRGIATVSLVLVLVSACRESGSEPKRAATTRPDVSASPAITAEGETGDAVMLSTWRARYSLWVTDLRVALEQAGTLRHARGRPVALVRLGAEKREDYDAAVAALRDCEASLDALGEPPAGAADAGRVLRRACRAFARGAETAAGAPYPRTFAHWSEAAGLVRRANAKLAERELIERLPVPVAGGVTDETRVEPFFSEVANDLAAPAAQVRCWAEPEWTWLKRQLFGRSVDIAGFASHETKRAGLSADVCHWLALLAYTEKRPTGIDQLEVAFAVNVLMHESGHLNMTGDFYGAGHNEPLAECWAMQQIRHAARRLGAETAYANTLAERYWAEIYPHVGPRYRTPKCRDGGPYDERPGSNVWP